MPYDKTLADRVRKSIGGQAGLSEKEMFGGIAFMIRGNVACGVIGDELLVRVGPAGNDAALEQPHARPFDFSGRPSRGWIMLGAGGVAQDAELKKWVEQGVAFARTLPAK